jgi:2-polyprenyl-3-methyl-5-hydroxy-6-metoxy-1,4-benzoquinol methylase
MNLGDQPLSGKFPLKDDPDPPIAPLQLVKCDDSENPDACGLVQLKHSCEPDTMYCNDYGYLSGMNQTMSEHLKDVTSKIQEKAKLREGDIVVDIGSNDGTLLKSYDVKRLFRVGIDPGGEQYQKYYPEDINLITGFFPSEKFDHQYKGQKAKVITSIAMFYDLEDPFKFAQNIKKNLAMDGIWVLEQSYLPTMLKNTAFDTICHEHLEYYALKQIEYILNLCDMKVIDVEINFINGGSFKVYATHKNTLYPINWSHIMELRKSESLLQLNTPTPYLAFASRVQQQKEKLTNFIKSETKQGKKFYVYGASTKGNVLINYFGLTNKEIIAAADRNSDKWVRKMPGSHIPIISEEDARAQNPDYFIVLPWHFKQEFIMRESKFLNTGGKFVFPLPEFDVVGKDGSQ